MGFVLTVVSSVDPNLEVGRVLTFEEDAVTLGRRACSILLRDSDKRVSRQHATILWESGEYRLLDESRNGTFVNGQLVGEHMTHPLRHQDLIQIGHYQFAIDLRAEASNDDLDEDPFDPLDESRGPVSLDIFLPDDSFSPLHGQRDRAPDFGPSNGALSGPSGFLPFDDMGEGSHVSPKDQFVSDLTPKPPSLLPDDYNPINTVFPNDQEQGLNREQGLKPPFVQPRPSGEPPVAPVPVRPPVTEPRGGSPRGGSQATARPQRPPPQQQTEQLKPADNLAAYRAFLRGAGLETAGLVPASNGEKELEKAGEMFRLFTEGLVNLLQAVSDLKREYKIDRTGVGPVQNNPLKFAGNVEVALGHLLGSTQPGYMDGDRAVQDAFAGLRAHELGVAEGTGAALKQLLGRFLPEDFERKAGAKRGVPGIGSFGAKGRAWQAYCEFYREQVEPLDKHYFSLWGDEFNRAYVEIAESIHANANLTGDPTPVNRRPKRRR